MIGGLIMGFLLLVVMPVSVIMTGPIIAGLLGGFLKSEADRNDEEGYAEFNR